MENTNWFSKYVFFGLMTRSNGNVHIRAFIVIIILFGLSFLAAWMDNLLIVSGPFFGLLEDLANYANLLSLYLLIVYVAKFAALFENTFGRKSPAIEEQCGFFRSVEFNRLLSKKDYDSAYSTFSLHIKRETKRSKTLYLLLMAAGVAVNIVAEFEMLGSDLSWAYQGKRMLTFVAATVQNVTIWWFVYPEIVFILLTCLLGAVKLWMKLAKSKAVILSPLSYDERGGLLSIAKFYLHVIKILAFPLLFVTAYTFFYGLKLMLIAALSFWILCVVVVFFLPLLPIHAYMKAWKRTEMIKIEQLFRRSYSQYQNAIESQSNVQLEELVNIGNVFSLTKSLPTWPYDWRILRKFFSIIVIPTIVFIIQLVASMDIIFNPEKLNKLFHFFIK